MTIPTETDAEMALRLQREFNSAPVASVTSTKSDNSIPIQASTIVALPRPTSTGSESLLGGEVMMDCTGGGRGGAAVVTVPNGAAGIQVARPQPVAPITAIAMPGYNYYNSNIPASGNERLVALFSMARAIRTFASIDAFFILCYMGLFSFVFVGAAWGPVFGFLSARQYSHPRAVVYLIYYYLKILIDLLVLYTSGSLFTIFTLFVNIFICAVVSRWCRAVKSVTREERETLMRGGFLIDAGVEDSNAQAAAASNRV